MADHNFTTTMFKTLQTEVHVWYCNPQHVQDAAKLQVYESVLSAQEIEQYHRFRFDKDKHSYLVSHALLRFSLSKYTDIRPDQWQFSRNAHGKPALVLPPGSPALCFNLTHTDGLSACIIASEVCGIDAENINRKNKLGAVAKRMFADEELQQLDEKNIQQQFYYYWTLREAYVKALGTGLAGSSKAFYFDIDKKNMSAAILHRNRRPADEKSWQFSLYEPALEHVIAVAFAADKPLMVQVAEFTP